MTKLELQHKSICDTPTTLHTDYNGYSGWVAVILWDLGKSIPTSRSLQLLTGLQSDKTGITTQIDVRHTNYSTYRLQWPNPAVSLQSGWVAAMLWDLGKSIPTSRSLQLLTGLQSDKTRTTTQIDARQPDYSTYRLQWIFRLGRGNALGPRKVDS